MIRANWVNCWELCLNFPVFVVVNVWSLTWLLPPIIQERSPHCRAGFSGEGFVCCSPAVSVLSMGTRNPTEGGGGGIQISLCVSFVDSSPSLLCHRISSLTGPAWTCCIKQEMPQNPILCLSLAQTTSAFGKGQSLENSWGWNVAGSETVIKLFTSEQGMDSPRCPLLFCSGNAALAWVVRE